MKKKIIGILVCTLLITTAIPVLGIQKDEFVKIGSMISIINNKEITKLNNCFVEPVTISDCNKNIISNYVPGEFIVKFKTNAIVDIKKSFDGVTIIGMPSIDYLNEIHHVNSIEKLFNSNKKFEEKNPYKYNIFKFSVKQDSDILSIVKDYTKNQYVIYAEPNYIIHMYETPNDLEFNKQWALYNTGQTGGTPDADIDATEAWDIETGDKNIIIAVPDTGVDWNHPDLENNIWVNPGEDINDNGIVDPSDFNDIDDDGNGFVDDIRGWDFVDSNISAFPGEDGTVRDNDPMDFGGHGTHCSGIASAVTNNNEGIAGVCWNCSIMPIRAGFITHSERSEGELDDIAAGIIYAADNGADVMSNSWGSFDFSNLIKDAMDYAYSQGVVLVAGAGNFDVNQKCYPAGLDNVISVAATDHNDNRVALPYWGSEFGSWIDIAAPGADIYSTMFNDTYSYESGTSMACPHVAGLAGLILSKNPDLNQEEIRTILRSTTDEVNSEFYIGTGRINAYKAIQRDSTPIASLNSILDDAIVSGEVSILGTASGSTFVNYSVWYGEGVYPDEWIEIFSSTTPVIDDILADLDTTSLLEDETYSVRLLVYDSVDQLSEDRSVIIIDNEPNPPGWYLQWTRTYGAPRAPQSQPIGDIDEDGVNEIFISSIWEHGSDGRCHILSYDEEKKTYVLEHSWSIDANNYWITPSGVCVLDLDNDKDLEFCIAWGDTLADGIYAYDWDGTTLTQLDWYNGEGFDLSFGGLCPCDYDDDGDLELIFANDPTFGPGNKHVTALGWDNQGFTEEAFWSLPEHTNKGCMETISGDMDNDGKDEIVVTISKWNSLSTAGTWILNWNKDLGEWEHEAICTNYSNTAVWGLATGDLNRNGIPEIGVGSGNWLGGNAFSWLYEWDGKNYNEVWHKEYPNEASILNAIEIGDADNDGINELCIGTDIVHIYQWDGTAYIEEATLTESRHRLCSLNIGDCDSDGLNELKTSERENYPPGAIGSDFIYEYIHPIEITLSSGFGVKATIKNTGKVDLTDVKCNFTITGGIIGLINKKSTKTISSLKVEESVTVSSGLFLGFGKIAITVEVSYDGWIPALKYTNGRQIIIYTTVEN